MRRLLVPTLCLFTACGPLEEAEPHAPTVASRTDAILGGRLNFRDPEVFVMFMDYPTGGAICTATLIGRRTLLTAAHCVAPENGVPPEIYVTNHPSFDFAPNSIWINATKSHAHPFYREDVIGKYDVAAVELEIEPPVPLKQVNRESIDNFMYQEMRVVGYGLTNTETDDSGLKRSGITKISEVRTDQFDFGRSGAKRSGTCSGDSGGPSLYTFGDGVERIIGVHSFHSGSCGNNTDARIDRFLTKMDEWLNEFEGGACSADKRCQTQGCTTPDPDCACLEDGQCNAACGAGTSDPDCPASCAQDGVCSKATCASPDPDCQSPGNFCGYAGHCNSRLCITSEQHERPYCSVPCSGTTACPNGLACVAGQCQHPVLPAANEGDPCTMGATYCGGPELRCTTWAKDSTPRCMRGCYLGEGCLGGYSCTTSSDDPDLGVCVKDITLPVLRDPPLPAFGCTSAGWSAVFPLGALAFFLRRRRR
ncbi:MAG: hypothetical protein AMXMBFR34_39410 [Myxococcaceae bacterium]